jgi:hypothetical protein
MPTSLAQLQADVMTLVKRPDLVNAIALHTKNAILKVHSSDYYLPDLYENSFTFAVSDTQYSLDTKLLLSRWRKAKYLNVLDPTSGEITKKLNRIDVLNSVDDYSYVKDYVFYEAGNYLQIRASGGEQVYGFGCFLYPDTTLVTPSWIVDQFPYAVQYEAARTLFKTIGYDEQSAAMERLVAEAIAEVKMVGLATIGE